MKRYRLAALLALAFPSVGFTAVECVGTVNQVLLYADGTLNVRSSWRNDFTFLCNTNGTFGTVSGEVCMGWYALMTKAEASNLNVSVFYFTNTPCNSLPTYDQAPVPVYVGLN